MYRHSIVLLCFLTAVLGLMSLTRLRREAIRIDKINIDAMSVEWALENLGDQPLKHKLSNYSEDKAKLGEQLITSGYALIGKKKSKRISKHFVCTDCHNTSREFADLSSQSPEDRLKYAGEKALPYLPGSTFFGIYNRTQFYNGDYYKKYGDLVTAAKDTLANAVQLCAKYCSAGRYLEEWELEAILHYFKKKELLIGDLDLSSNDKKNIAHFQDLNAEERSQFIDLIKGKYTRAYNATFVGTLDRNLRKYGENGDAQKGERIYTKSCLHCHGNARVTYLNLGPDKLSAKMFLKNLSNYSDKSIYQIVRWGTYSKVGRQHYMPLYTQEKMSDEQINDLVAYFNKIVAK